MMEVCWPAGAKTTCCVWTYFSLTHCYPCVPVQFLQHARRYIKAETPASIGDTISEDTITYISSIYLDSVLG